MTLHDAAVRITASFTAEEAERLAVYARQNERSVSAEVRLAVRAWLQPLSESVVDEAEPAPAPVRSRAADLAQVKPDPRVKR